MLPRSVPDSISIDTCYTFRPGFEEGIDAYLRSLTPNTNYGEHPDFSATAWTFGGQYVAVRNLLFFDLFSIPQNAVVSSAKLSLYSYNSPWNGSHSTMSGSNEAYLSRVISSWNEYAVTWNTMPTITTQNHVYLPATLYAIQDYIDIDVTLLVQDMLADPFNSYGFMMQLITEQFYRRMLFASSDHADSTLHPKLEVCFTYTAGLKGAEDPHTLQVRCYPNPARDILTVENTTGKEIRMKIVNSIGEPVFQGHSDATPISLDLSTFPAGMYMIRIEGEDWITQKKVIKE